METEEWTLPSVSMTTITVSQKIFWCYVMDALESMRHCIREHVQQDFHRNLLEVSMDTWKTFRRGNRSN